MTHEPTRREHMDRLLLIELAERHDQANGNEEAPDGTVAGIDALALLGQAGARAHTMLDYLILEEGFQDLTGDQRDYLIRILAGMWQDGFVIGAAYRAVRPTGD